MGFVEEHTKWLEHHMRGRSGECRSRLERGHAHGERMFLERVWWPVFGHLNDLYPEYEVSDWRGRPYFVDFVWMPGRYKFAIEIKGFGSHVQNMDRIRYRKELDRETYLQIAGYRVISVPYDDLEEQPELTMSLLKSLFSPYIAAKTENGKYTRMERDALLMAIRMNQPIRPADLVIELGINRRTAVNCLKSLCDKGKFRAMESSKGARISRYEFIHSFSDQWLW